MLIPDLLYGDANLLKTKIARFKAAGADKLHAVFDFDRTLTVSRPGADGDVTTWHIMKDHLHRHGQTRYQKLFEHYRELELSGVMDQEQAVTWWSSILDLFVEYNVNIREVEQDFLSKATIRPHAKELFNLCDAHGIPTVILSAGIKDIIEIWAKAYDIQPTTIHATKLNLDKDGIVCDWDKDSLVHILNKREKGNGHDAIAKTRQQRPMTLLIGDSPDDANMAEGNEAVLRIFISDPRIDEKHTSRAKASPVFDATILTGDLRPIVRLLESIIN